MLVSLVLLSPHPNLGSQLRANACVLCVATWIPTYAGCIVSPYVVGQPNNLQMHKLASMRADLICPSFMDDWASSTASFTLSQSPSSIILRRKSIADLIVHARDLEVVTLRAAILRIVPTAVVVILRWHSEPSAPAGITGKDSRLSLYRHSLCIYHRGSYSSGSHQSVQSTCRHHVSCHLWCAGNKSGQGLPRAPHLARGMFLSMPFFNRSQTTCVCSYSPEKPTDNNSVLPQ